jgi:DNA-binding MarR family transcriptional regulator
LLGVNGVDLFLLGRTLMKIGEEAMPTEGLGEHTRGVRSVLVVVGDVRENPGSSVGEIAERTGLPQSAVSTAIARLRETGAVVTTPDPADRRRVLIEPAARISARVAKVRSTSINGALGEALGSDDPDDIAEVVGLLERLATRLGPRAGTHPRS